MKNTFVKINNEQHFKDVVRAYVNAGYEIRDIQNRYDRSVNTVGICKNTGDVNYDKIISCTYDTSLYGDKELIIKNGELVMKNEVVNWERTYVNVNGEHEYNLAVGAYKKLTGLEVSCIEIGHERYDGYVGICNSQIISYKTTLFKTSKIPLSELLKAAKMDNKSRRTKLTLVKEGNEYQITKIENVLTKEECEKIAPGYITDQYSHYYLVGDKVQLIHPASNVLFGVGDYIGEYRIGLMKRAGERFVKCRKKAVEKKKEIVITI